MNMQNKRLKIRIEEFNKIKYKQLPFLSYNSKRIIVGTLKQESDKSLKKYNSSRLMSY